MYLGSHFVYNGADVVNQVLQPSLSSPEQLCYVVRAHRAFVAGFVQQCENKD